MDKTSEMLAMISDAVSDWMSNEREFGRDSWDETHAAALGIPADPEWTIDIRDTPDGLVFELPTGAVFMVKVEQVA